MACPSANTQPPSAVLPAPRWSFPGLWPYHLGFWKQDPRLDWFCSGFLGGRSLPKNQGSIVGKWRNLSVCQWLFCWFFHLSTVVLLVILLAVLVVFLLLYCLIDLICLLHLTDFWSNLLLLPLSCQETVLFGRQKILQQKRIQVPWGLKGIGTRKFQMQWMFLGETKITCS